MPTFIEGLLLVGIIFGFCVGLAVIIKITTLYVEDKMTKKPQENQNQSKIYLIKESPPPVKRTKKKRRSPKIAFEGLVLTPEKVNLANINQTSNPTVITNKKQGF